MNVDALRLFRRSDSALSAPVADDFVALRVDVGRCYGMSDVSAAVWAMLEQPVSLDAIVARLVDTYEVSEAQCRLEVSELLQQMIQEGLVDPAQ